MRARRKKMKRFKDMVPEASFRMPRWKSLEGMLEADPEILNEISMQDNALETRVGAREQYESRRPGQEPNVPYIAGYTNMANASPEMRMAGYLEWIGKSPQQRYEDSELGRQVSMSMSSRNPGNAQLSDMAQGNSYWAGLARNVAFGDGLPVARLPDMDAFEGQKWSDPKNTSPMGEAAMTGSVELAGGGERAPQNTYTGFANQPPTTRQTQSLEGITRSAFQNPALQDAARQIEELQKTDPEAAKEAEAALFKYMGDTYGISDQRSVSRVFNLLRGRS